MKRHRPSKLERETARANAAESRLRLLAKAVADAQETSRKFDMDIEREYHRLPSFVRLASQKVHADISHAFMVSIGAR
ncbi:MAG: hypothetical protein ACK4WH_00880 [Phycisphaerales bacterium]